MNNECYCVTERQWYRVKYIAYMVFGLTFGLIMAYVYESMLAPFVSWELMVICVAPLVEEPIKTFLVLGEKKKNQIFFTLITVALGFAVGEWMLKSAYEGSLIISATPAIHLLTVLPLSVLYARKQTPGYYLLGLGIGMAIHSLYNAYILYVAGV